jgi:wyosine [tRNA(Phe)-imidazoG37] synthetase (radical SAM superfamily)
MGVETALRHVFGPVMSGRLGRSLGLDLLGARVCTMNCVYCESGPLQTLTLKRAPYVPADELLAELRQWEAGRAERGEPLPDVVTLGGMGEPTLNSDMPQIIAGVRGVLPGVPVAVLTNASLMTDAQVCAELARADMVLPSLDSLVTEEFLRVNRGHPGLDPKAVADGILSFRRETAESGTGSQTKLYLEVLLVAGVNDSLRNLELLTAYCNELQPDRVDVTTLSRPGTEAWAKPVDAATLALWRAALSPCAVPQPQAPRKEPAKEKAGEHHEDRAGLAGRAEKRQEQAGGMSLAEASARIQAAILASVARRPQTMAQLASALLADAKTVEHALSELLAQGLAEEVRRETAATNQPAADVYYQARG